MASVTQLISGLERLSVSIEPQIWRDWSQMSDRASPKTIMQKIVAIFNTGDMSEVDLIFSPDYVDHQKPPGMEIDGPGEFKQIVTDARQSVQKLVISIEDLIAESDKVAARLRWHIIDLTGKEIHRETIDILHLESDRVVEHWGAEAWRMEKYP